MSHWKDLINRDTFNIVQLIYSSAGQRACGELLPTLGTHHSSIVNFLHFILNILLRNFWVTLIQPWLWWSLSGTLSKLCPTVSPSLQDWSIHIGHYWSLFQVKMSSNITCNSMTISSSTYLSCWFFLEIFVSSTFMQIIQIRLLVTKKPPHYR